MFLLSTDLVRLYTVGVGVAREKLGKIREKEMRKKGKKEERIYGVVGGPLVRCEAGCRAWGSSERAMLARGSNHRGLREHRDDGRVSPLITQIFADYWGRRRDW